MDKMMDHNTRRAIQAIAKRNREDAAQVAEFYKREMLETNGGLFVVAENSPMALYLGIVQQAKTQAAMIERFLEKMENLENPAIDRTR